MVTSVILTAVLLRTQVFRDATLCRWVSANRRFGETCFSIQGQIKETTCTRVGTLIVATIYLQLMQNRYMFRSFAVLQCSHQHCVQPVASDVELE